MTSPKHTDFTETTISSKTVYRGNLLHVLEDEVQLPDGARSWREYVRHPGAVMMVPFLDRDTVLLVRQFRYPLGRHFLELPAGKIDRGEEPIATARRELREECGYAAGSWDHLATFHPCVGYSDERIELYLARELAEAGSAPDDGEFIETRPTALAQALAWVRDGTITDAKTVIGLLWADRFRDW
ncbi:MAG: NUDIX hydrolase [Betaproteobacteria bacterium]|nr:NUDIX hydrolase [Betaproteobacteria bacterium]